MTKLVAGAHARLCAYRQLSRAKHVLGLDRPAVRRLIPASDDLRPLYVTGYGFSIGKFGGVLQIKEKGSVVQEARLNDVSQVNVFGSVSV